MKPILASLLLFGAALTPLSGATVNFSSGGGLSTVVFETTTGSEMAGGTLFAGTFAAPPAVGISFDDILSDFMIFDSIGPSGAAGNFTSSKFESPVEPSFASGNIYLVASDTAVLADATEFAVFTASDWQFPANDTTAQPSSITLAPDPPVVDYLQMFAGMRDTIDNPGGIAATFNSIQLEQIPEPSASLLALLGVAGLLRRRR